MANSRIEATQGYSQVQVSDDNIFVNTFAIFYDWNDYIKNKTGQNLRYLVLVRLPSPDDRYMKLLAFDTSRSMYYFFINRSAETITYKGIFTFQ